jgi:biopolymer transport protein ExbB/TolQ
MDRQAKSNISEATLSWHRNDLEQRLGFGGGRFTKTNALLTFILGVIASVALYVVLIYFFRDTSVGMMFIDRGFTPYVMTVLFFWSVSTFLLKLSKLRFQRRALKKRVVSSEHDFVLSVHTVDSVLEEIYAQVDDPRQFVVFNRILVALSNLRNLGRVADVDEMLRTQAEFDENAMETSYSLVRGFIWAIPVLGFVGTVMGLSQAVGGFGEVLSKTADPSQLAEALKLVTSGLATAFETTLVALLFALVLQITMTFLHKNEEEFLDECSDYCQRQVVSRLRLMPFEQVGN